MITLRNWIVCTSAVTSSAHLTRCLQLTLVVPDAFSVANVTLSWPYTKFAIANCLRSDAACSWKGGRLLLILGLQKAFASFASALAADSRHIDTLTSCGRLYKVQVSLPAPPIRGLYLIMPSEGCMQSSCQSRYNCRDIRFGTRGFRGGASYQKA